MSLPNIKLFQLDQVYAKDDKLKKEDVEEVVRWVNSQPHLPKISELQAALYLHSCYYSISATKTTIDTYFTHRTQHRFLFERPSVETVEETFKYTLITCPLARTSDGCMVIYMKFIDPDLRLYNSLHQIQLCNMVIMLNLYQHGPSNGMKVVFDAGPCTIWHITRIHWTGLKEIMFHVQDAIPLRIKEIHFLNVNFAINKFITLLKPLMKKELGKTLLPHKSTIEILDYIESEFVPEEWGGTGGSLAQMHERSVRNVLENMDFFVWQDTQLVDEAKRAKNEEKKGWFKLF